MEIQQNKKDKFMIKFLDLQKINLQYQSEIEDKLLQFRKLFKSALCCWRS